MSVCVCVCVCVYVCVVCVCECVCEFCCVLSIDDENIFNHLSGENKREQKRKRKKKRREKKGRIKEKGAGGHDQRFFKKVEAQGAAEEAQGARRCDAYRWGWRKGRHSPAASPSPQETKSQVQVHVSRSPSPSRKSIESSGIALRDASAMRSEKVKAPSLE